jgi:hypothetical protein
MTTGVIDSKILMHDREHTYASVTMCSNTQIMPAPTLEGVATPNINNAIIWK